MDFTRLSFFYLFAYLTVGGVSLMASPDTFLTLLSAQNRYGAVMPRVVAMLMLSLAIFVAQIIRKRVQALYMTTLIVRGFLAICLLVFYFAFHEVLFLIVVGIILLGVSLTTAGMVADKLHHKP
jgi:hypothetical protein